MKVSEARELLSKIDNDLEDEDYSKFSVASTFENKEPEDNGFDISDYFYGGDFICNLEYTEEFMYDGFHIKLVEIEYKKSFDKEDTSAYMVFTINGEHFMITGFYCSYDGFDGDFDELSKCKKVTKTITYQEWEPEGES